MDEGIFFVLVLGLLVCFGFVLLGVFCFVLVLFLGLGFFCLIGSVVLFCLFVFGGG